MRRIRAVLIIAALWGTLWFLLGIGTRAAFASQLHADFEPPPPFFELPKLFLVWGSVAGSVFAVFLIVVERRRTLHSLARVRVSAWGALGSLTFPVAFILSQGIRPGSLLFTPYLLISVLSATLGAACAAGTLALARRAPATPEVT